MRSDATPSPAGCLSLPMPRVPAGASCLHAATYAPSATAGGAAFREKRRYRFVPADKREAVLRLRANGFPEKTIATALDLPRGTIATIIRTAAEQGDERAARLPPEVRTEHWRAGYKNPPKGGTPRIKYEVASNMLAGGARISDVMARFGVKKRAVYLAIQEGRVKRPTRP